LSSKSSRDGASPGGRLARHTQPRRFLRDPARTERRPRRGDLVAAIRRWRARACRRRSNDRCPPSFRIDKLANHAPKPKQSGSPEMSRHPTHRFPHQLKTQIPIDRTPHTAGSFLQDFRTPSAPETLKVSRLTLKVFRPSASGAASLNADTYPKMQMLSQIQATRCLLPQILRGSRALGQSTCIPTLLFAFVAGGKRSR
jgi:hypothetical protein